MWGCGVQEGISGSEMAGHCVLSLGFCWLIELGVFLDKEVKARR